LMQFPAPSLHCAHIFGCHHFLGWCQSARPFVCL
jgi:hypothetical protein